MEQQITAPSPSDLEELLRRYRVIDELAKAHLGYGLDRSDEDLIVLQKLLDRGVPRKDETVALQCMGIVFGMRLAAAVKGLDWAIVTDEYGRDPALRWGDSTLLVFPLTMISKRVEDGTEFTIAELFDGVVMQLESLQGEAT